VPTGGDLYLLKFIRRDWDDERLGKIVAKIRQAIDRQQGGAEACRPTPSAWNLRDGGRLFGSKAV
jgi:hypothetical protein